MFMVPTNAAVCQVMSVTEKEAVTVSFKSTSGLNMTHYVSILRDWGTKKEKRPSLSLLILSLLKKLYYYLEIIE